MHCQLRPADGETTYMLIDPCHSLTMHLNALTEMTPLQLLSLILKICEVVTYLAYI